LCDPEAVRILVEEAPDELRRLRVLGGEHLDGDGAVEPLVEAARASLREEGRPDPFIGDPRGFRRWVSARLPRALIAECAGEVVWVGYADVRIEEGWLLQGIYTWPAWRRRGLAAAGVTALCRSAFASRAEHVQLSVVEGNLPAHSLYESLGFHPHTTLRTLLFI
jgi:GNAT superfamily N-acetyltransferase